MPIWYWEKEFLVINQTCPIETACLKNSFHLYKKKITILKYCKLLSQLPPSIPLSAKSPPVINTFLSTILCIFVKGTSGNQAHPWEYRGSSVSMLIFPSKHMWTQEWDFCAWAVSYSLCFQICFFFHFISWRLITLQYCSGFCHTLTWISHGFTCVPHPDPPSHPPLHPIPLGLPSAPNMLLFGWLIGCPEFMTLFYII